MQDTHIHIEDKSYINPKYRAVKQIIKALELTIHAHEFVCLIGHSGCGKTTLLNLLAGLDNDYTGAITLSKKQHTPKISYVFQSPRLLPWRTVVDNIRLAADEITTEDLDFLLQGMGLSAEKQSYPNHLSLGMSRRVEIIRAFATHPDLLLMDEPFVSLDPPTARTVRQLLVDLWQKRPHSILFVTHDLREAIALADRLIFLDSNPMSVKKEIQVDIPREQRGNEIRIEHFRQQLFIDYPEIITLL